MTLMTPEELKSNVEQLELNPEEVLLKAVELRFHTDQAQREALVLELLPKYFELIAQSAETQDMSVFTDPAHHDLVLTVAAMGAVKLLPL